MIDPVENNSFFILLISSNITQTTTTTIGAGTHQSPKFFTISDLSHFRKIMIRTGSHKNMGIH